MVAIENIYEEIGGFGRFQVLMIVWVYGIKFMIAWSTLLMSFGGFKPDYACLVDNLWNQTEVTSFNENQLRQYSQAGAKNQTFLNVCELNGTQCEEFYFFGSKRTVITEWNLVCDLKWMKPTIISIQFCGVLIGAVIGGQSGDYFGRKKTLYGSYLVHTLLNVVCAFSLSWQMLSVLRFFIGIMIGIVLVMVVPYPTEFFPLRWRHTIPGIPMWPGGLLFFSGAAWLLEDWSYLHLTIAALGIPGLLGYFYIPESARWLATRGRLDEAHAALEKMARLNRKRLPESAMDTLKEIAKGERINNKGKRYSYLDIFRTRYSAKLSVIFAFQWVVMSMIVYGLNFAVASFAGNLYLNMFLINIVQFPAHLISFILISRIGRRWTCLVFLGVCTLASFTCVGVQLKAPEDLRDRLISASCFTAKLALAAAWSASQTWVTESYPTVTRSLGYGFANMASRVGAIIAPFVINLDDMPLFTFILMGSLTFISTVVSLVIPETLNKVMAETVTEQEMVATCSNQAEREPEEKPVSDTAFVSSITESAASGSNETESSTYVFREA